ncbi:MAG: UvrD-helicase domain-containing protein [Polyangiaceae bacterium]|nr:UvrD-helicase domain-containing protein [Polyangiaceae bacterium]
MAVGLNPSQKEAVEHVHGPLLVLAGAGSGKTRVITHRIARLLEHGIPRSAILALTFTNKAAQEMEERVHALIRPHTSSSTPSSAHRPADRKKRAASKGASKGTTPSKDTGPTICTFHAFGLRVLTEERKSLGGNFTIFDQGDSFGTIREILREIKLDKRFDIAAIATRISNAKNAFLSPEELEDDAADAYTEITKLVYGRYISALKKFRAYDFDDLVCGVARIWEERSDVLERWQKRYQFILVDEYQDTNRAQLKLLTQLAAGHKNLCVVGDDDQSIYAWRGADMRNILEFEDQFANARIIKLEQNYRSRRPILDVANAVIAKRVDSRHRKTLFTERDGGVLTRVVATTSPEIECQFVVREIQTLQRDRGIKFSDFAILYRSNAQAKLMEEHLRLANLPYRMIGGQQFFERKEVKDILAYMKFALNRNDEISLRRIINYPARGIGDTSVERLSQHATAKGWTLWQAVERVDLLDDVSASAREACKDLEKIFVELRDRLLIQRQAASVVAKALCERIRLREDLEAAAPSMPAARRKWDNMESLFNTFAKREATIAGRSPQERELSLSAFLHSLTLQLSDEEDASGANQMTLSTLHGAKGLEWPIVFLVGCEEGYLPHSRTLDSKVTDATPADIEEERRLFYVGVTRAREELILTRAKARPLRAKLVARTPSRFLIDIPKNLIVEEECSIDVPLQTEDAAVKASDLLKMLESFG